MTDSPILKRLLDSGTQFGEMSQKNAEKLVNDFVKAGQLRRKDAAKTAAASRRPRQVIDRAGGQRDPSRGVEAARQVRRAPRRCRGAASKTSPVPRRRLEGIGEEGRRAKKAAAKPQVLPASPRSLPRKAPAKKAAGEEGRGQEGSGEEGRCQEGSGEEGACQEGSAKKLACRGASGSMPRWCAAGWSRAGQRQGERSRPGWCWSTVPLPTSQPAGRPGRRGVAAGTAVALRQPWW